MIEKENKQKQPNEPKLKYYLDEIVDFLLKNKDQVGIIYVLSRNEAGLNSFEFIIYRTNIISFKRKWDGITYPISFLYSLKCIRNPYYYLCYHNRNRQRTEMYKIISLIIHSLHNFCYRLVIFTYVSKLKQMGMEQLYLQLLILQITVII